MQQSPKLGKVYLVGAGPGDPKLITMRGVEAIGRADAIVYDRLVSPRLLKHRKPGARLIFVGKLPDKHMMKQEDINRLLVELAMEGLVVTRLKGGDPSVFGRVGEEAETLANNGIPFELVPGVTSAIAVPAYAGIPVTHRDLTSSFAIVTGHEYPNKTYDGLQWEHLAKGIGTIIFLMGVANLEHICEELVKHGKPDDVPVALIRWGTWMEQRTLVGTLGDIAAKAKAAAFSSPAVIIVGDVVKMREKLAWFESKPLFGRRVLVTRSRSQSSELAASIDELGGEAVEFPVIALAPPSDPDRRRELDDAIARLPEFDWVFFTSVNGVEFFMRRLRELRLDIRTMAKAKVAAVGPATAQALLAVGLVPEALPQSYDAEGVLEAFAAKVKAGEKALLPTADIARETLAQGLASLGLSVTRVCAYENVPNIEEDGEDVLRLLRERAIHAVTFTSSSTVRNLLHALKALGEQEPLALLEGVQVFCIGPRTAETARALGLDVGFVAEESTIAGLLAALAGESQAVSG